jgi:hypothetical protein
MLHQPWSARAAKSRAVSLREHVGWQQSSQMEQRIRITKEETTPHVKDCPRPNPNHQQEAILDWAV